MNLTIPEVVSLLFQNVYASDSDDRILDVFDGNTVVLASGADSGASGKTYLGRPWGGTLDHLSVLDLVLLADQALLQRMQSRLATSYCDGETANLCFSRVIFKNTVITAPLNKALWSVWNTGDERTSNVFFAEYNTSGSGASGASRPGFARVLSASEAASYSISSAVGSDYASWVDVSYL